jgi:hypothetical protein
VFHRSGRLVFVIPAKPETRKIQGRILLNTGFRRYDESGILDCPVKPNNDKYGVRRGKANGHIAS